MFDGRFDLERQAAVDVDGEHVRGRLSAQHLLHRRALGTPPAICRVWPNFPSGDGKSYGTAMFPRFYGARKHSCPKGGPATGTAGERSGP